MHDLRVTDKENFELFWTHLDTKETKTLLKLKMPMLKCEKNV